MSEDSRLQSCCSKQTVYLFQRPVYGGDRLNAVMRFGKDIGTRIGVGINP